MVANHLDPHGQFSILTYRSVVYVRPLHSWNLQCAHLYEAALLQTLRELKQHHNSFFSIVDLRYWQLGTQDALDYIAKIRTKPEDYILDKLGDIFLGGDAIQTDVSEKKYINRDRGYWHLATSAEVVALLQSLSTPCDIEALAQVLESDTAPLHPLSPT